MVASAFYAWYAERMVSVLDARTKLLASLEEGSVCPCCDRLAKAYKRRLYSTQIMALLRMYRDPRINAGEEFHLGKFLGAFEDVSSRGGDVARMQYWGLIQPTRAGNYRLTPDGRAFVEGRVLMPAWKWFYDGAVLEGKLEEAPLVTMSQILKEDESSDTEKDKERE